MMKTKIAMVTTAAMLLMSTWSSLIRAASETISVIIPWQGDGQIFQISTDGLRFLGTLEGIMYVETAEGQMNEAFVRCPIVQDINVNDQSTSATGTCMIVASTEDSAFAEISCEGRAGVCRGEFKLTGGTGRFAGIGGSGKMTIRSPVHALAADMSNGTVLHAAAGILQIPSLKITLP